jgi:hypothetical protein
LAPTRTTERVRLTAEYDRAARVRDAIDAATGASHADGDANHQER